MSDNIGLLFRCEPEKISESLSIALVRHEKRFGTQAKCIYVNPENFSEFSSSAISFHLKTIQDRTMLKNHFWITAQVKS